MKSDPASPFLPVGLLGRDESGLHGVELSTTGAWLLADENIILANIRDAARIREVSERFMPDIVFCAAELKHLPLVEQYSAEATKTNAIGTLSVLGLSKRATERLSAEFARRMGWA